MNFYKAFFLFSDIKTGNKKTQLSVAILLFFFHNNDKNHL